MPEPAPRSGPAQATAQAAVLAAFAATALLAAAPAAADRGGEVSFLGGITLSGEGVANEDSDANPDAAVGLRGASIFTSQLGWYIDAMYAGVSTGGTLGGAEVISARTGLEVYLGRNPSRRWFLSGGGGWMDVDYDNSITRDFDRTFVSGSFGQRLWSGGTSWVRWEVRGDVSVSDDGLNGDTIGQGWVLVGYGWGHRPAGELPRATRVPRMRSGDPGPGDADGDGVDDRRDRCPDTPAGAVVDGRGCPRDADRDGVPDGIDRCPGTPPGQSVGADGCYGDDDGDGVLGGRDRCPDTPRGAIVDDRGCPIDSDGDGVPEGVDMCPTTPRGAIVDRRGCRIDTDADGVADGLDACPDTPAGALVDVRGCPADADRDGVPDGYDQCERTPPGVLVNDQGCSIDGDGDGVLDDADRCPDTPADVAVDAEGCSVQQPLFEPGSRTLVLEGVFFEHGSPRLTGDSREVLDEVAASLRAFPGLRVEVAGHTDTTGSEALNLRLSQQRAEAVRDYLIARGVEAGRLVARGYGESRPVADEDTAVGRARNRRVELNVLDR